MADLRQELVDAAVADIVHQLGSDRVDQHGVGVVVEGSFNMARVIEHVIRKAFSNHDPFMGEVARAVCPIGADWHDHTNTAEDAIIGVYGILMSHLNI